MTESWNSTVSSLLNNIYRCADKSSWYSGVARAYDRARPRYPKQLIDRVGQIAKIKPPAKVLEIGSGVGIASLELAQRGVKLIGLEPSLAACEIARQNCANYQNVEFINTTFEDWANEAEKFDAVVASTSFHWLTPGIRTQKTASVLNTDGYLVLLWNTPPQPEAEVSQTLAPVYQIHAPELAYQETLAGYQGNLAAFDEEIIASGYFQDLVRDQVVCQVNYSINKYISLLTTLSPYIQLPEVQRHNLLTELAKTLKSNYGDRLKLSYLSMFQVARKLK